MLIQPCANAEAEKLCMPFMCGWTVKEINSFFRHVENDTYSALCNYIAETSQTRMQILLDIVGDELEPIMV